MTEIAFGRRLEGDRRGFDGFFRASSQVQTVAFLYGHRFLVKGLDELGGRQLSAGLPFDPVRLIRNHLRKLGPYALA